MVYSHTATLKDAVTRSRAIVSQLKSCANVARIVGQRRIQRPSAAAALPGFMGESSHEPLVQRRGKVLFEGPSSGRLSHVNRGPPSFFVWVYAKFLSRFLKGLAEEGAIQSPRVSHQLSADEAAQYHTVTA